MNQLKSANKPKLGIRLQSELSSLINRGYRFGKKIGKGSYGEVLRAQYTEPDTGETKDLACKYVDRNRAPKDFLEKFFPREIEILTKVSHPNIVGVHSILQSGQTVFIFMVLAENGDLLDYIKTRGAIPEEQAGLWFFQMVSAIRYLHALGYAHRDLKCENILISGRRNIKIADFGFARKCTNEKNEQVLSQTYCGSACEHFFSLLDCCAIIQPNNFVLFAAYAAPEVIKGMAYDAMKSDIW